eukprot:scaffold87141_cov63-Phaeocystis_antarctica.AAC.1
MTVAQRLPVRPHRLLARLQLLLIQQSRLLRLAHLIEQPGQVDEQPIRPPLSRRQPPQRRPPLSDQGLAQQADDQCVALVEAHALVELVQNVGLVLSIAAVRLSTGEERLRSPRGGCMVYTRHGGAGVLTRRATRMHNPIATRVLLAHLLHVHPRQPRLDRVEVVVAEGCHQRPLEGLLLRRAHHHVELRAAHLGV